MIEPQFEPESPSPVEQLAGIRLKDRWDVLELDGLRDGESGRNFSACYIVEDSQQPGRRMFMKAIDLYRIMGDSENVIEALHPYIEIFRFEQRLLEECRGQDRVVTAVDSGQYTPKGERIPIPYLIFELAEGDMNRHLASGRTITFAWKMRSLQQIATGVRQLHRKRIAHQDIKPSNAVVFSDASKVADLGQASWQGVQGPWDDFMFPGDRGYAPPEFRYGYIRPEFERRRFGADVYMLGALGVYMFSGLHLNVLVEQELPAEYRPEVWKGSYQGVLPYYREAFYRVLERVRTQLPDDEIGRELLHLFTWLCEPNPMQRGYVKFGQTQPTEYSLERLVTRLDHLVGQAEINARRAAQEKSV